MGAAADHCLFPHSLPPGGGGGGEVTSAPRLAPSPAARTGFSSRVRLPDGSGDELGGWAGSSAAAMAAILAVKRLPVSTLPRLPGTGELWRSSHSAPERPRARTSPACLLASPLRPRFPRLELQVMLFLFCS